MHDAQPEAGDGSSSDALAATLEDCDRRLARYRAALEAGIDPGLVATWTARVQAERAAALAQARQAIEGPRRLSREEIRALVEALGDVRDVLREADRVDKAETYRSLGLRLTYQPATRTVHAEVELNTDFRGVMGRVRRATLPPTTWSSVETFCA